ncbi:MULTISPECIES: hypothetical protein [unclassified Agromyces]|jgi:hypothetical protein|uniref:hypothetical protein n=1 Tax=unclassified Agromyces TaxID=2639701 RepID=UPI0007B26832|nr:MULTISPECIES: hypothetical protein [unclassified Agromyces]KZE95734.1 hypothetical protein AVP42_00008 [Agromyces sp. NDB4Y10]MCK8609223.1 hypothetical protein [Agromyces sp. C10]
MDRLYYSGDSVLTGSAIARALLDYAGALADVRASATVRIPTRRPDGSLGHSTVLIGPASELISDEEPGEHDELVDEELVAYMAAETRKLRNIAVVGDVDEEEYDDY